MLFVFHGAIGSTNSSTEVHVAAFAPPRFIADLVAEARTVTNPVLRLRSISGRDCCPSRERF
jgi:hypothetical protein